MWSSEKQQDFIRKIGQEFTRDTGVTVEVQQITFGDIKTKYLTAAQAGEGARYNNRCARLVRRTCC